MFDDSSLCNFNREECGYCHIHVSVTSRQHSAIFNSLNITVECKILCTNFDSLCQIIRLLYHFDIKHF